MEDPGKIIWRVPAAWDHPDGARECPCKLVNGHYSVGVQWLNLKELTDEHAIFEVWETEQDRIAVTHLMDMPDLEWAKVDKEEGLYYMSREQYDAGNEQY